MNAEKLEDFIYKFERNMVPKYYRSMKPTPPPPGQEDMFDDSHIIMHKNANSEDLKNYVVFNQTTDRFLMVFNDNCNDCINLLLKLDELYKMYYDLNITGMQIISYNELRNDIPDELFIVNKSPIMLYYPKGSNVPIEYKHGLSARDI